MKGNPAEPKCGFSRKMIALLQEAGLDFGTFDILEDQVKSNASQKYIKFRNHHLFLGSERRTEKIFKLANLSSTLSQGNSHRRFRFVLISGTRGRTDHFGLIASEIQLRKFTKWF